MLRLLASASKPRLGLGLRSCRGLGLGLRSGLVLVFEVVMREDRVLSVMNPAPHPLSPLLIWCRMTLGRGEIELRVTVRVTVRVRVQVRVRVRGKVGLGLGP